MMIRNEEFRKLEEDFLLMKIQYSTLVKNYRKVLKEFDDQREHLTRTIERNLFLYLQIDALRAKESLKEKKEKYNGLVFGFLKQKGGSL